MMLLRIFAVKDCATGMFGNPMFLISVGQATRSFGDEINRAGNDNQLFNHPEDFELYSCGNYDSADGTFATGTPELIVRGKDLRVAMGGAV